MEGLAPALHLCLSVRLGLERGEGLRTLLTEYIKEHKHEVAVELFQWLTARDRGSMSAGISLVHGSPCRRTLFSLLDRGLRGEPIGPFLIELEKEMAEICERDLDEFITRLPFKALIPLLGLLFPAFLLLLLGPILGGLLSFL